MSFWTLGHSAGVWLHRLYKNWGARGGTLRTLKVARFGEIFVRRRLGASANFMASKGIVGGPQPDPGRMSQSPKAHRTPRAIMIHSQPKIPFWGINPCVILASLGQKIPRHARLLCILETSACAENYPWHQAQWDCEAVGGHDAGSHGEFPAHSEVSTPTETHSLWFECGLNVV